MKTTSTYVEPVAVALVLLAVFLDVSGWSGVVEIGFGCFGFPELLMMFAAALGIVFGLRALRQDGNRRSLAIAGIMIVVLYVSLSVEAGLRGRRDLDAIVDSGERMVALTQKGLRSPDVSQADREVLRRIEQEERFLMTGELSTSTQTTTPRGSAQLSQLDRELRLAIHGARRRVTGCWPGAVAWLAVAGVSVAVGVLSSRSR